MIPLIVSLTVVLVLVLVFFFLANSTRRNVLLSAALIESRTEKEVFA